MKYYKRLRIWKASNVDFNPETEEAYSFGWWCFVKRIGGKLVFNGYRYSNHTSRHQSKVFALLIKLGYHDIEYIEAPRGLQDLGCAVSYYENNIQELKQAIAKPRSHKTTNQRRQTEIREYEERLEILNKLLYYDEFDWEVDEELSA